MMVFVYIVFFSSNYLTLKKEMRKFRVIHIVNIKKTTREERKRKKRWISDDRYNWTRSWMECRN
jgi:hypothetical protein